MPPLCIRLAAIATGLALSSPAGAQGVLTHRDISFGLAKEIAETALEACRKAGAHVAVTVLDRSGAIRIAYRDDDAEPHTTDNSQRKAYTARTSRAPSSDMAKRLAAAPGALPQVYQPGISAQGGGVPIKAGNEIIGAIGVSGTPGKPGVAGGVGDEACAQAGIDKVADRLK
jgi:uncharacterized protein GlcG (DUF336 family)